MARTADYERLRHARHELYDAYNAIARAAVDVLNGDPGEDVYLRLLALKSDTNKLADAIAARIVHDGQPLQ